MDSFQISMKSTRQLILRSRWVAH